MKVHISTKKKEKEKKMIKIIIKDKKKLWEISLMKVVFNVALT